MTTVSAFCDNDVGEDDSSAFLENEAFCSTARTDLHFAAARTPNAVVGRILFYPFSDRCLPVLICGLGL